LIVYFDTSALVPIVIEERSSTVCARLWDEADRVVSSRLASVEGRAALALAYRFGRLNDESLRAAVRTFESLIEEMDAVELTAGLGQRAGALAEKMGLRGYDAVHLASAEALRDRDLVLATGDQALIQAAQS
jgi:predicted nucleic acid-binding protein